MIFGAHRVEDLMCGHRCPKKAAQEQKAQGQNHGSKDERGCIRRKRMRDGGSEKKKAKGDKYNRKWSEQWAESTGNIAFGAQGLMHVSSFRSVPDSAGHGLALLAAFGRELPLLKMQEIEIPENGRFVCFLHRRATGTDRLCAVRDTSGFQQHFCAAVGIHATPAHFRFVVHELPPRMKNPNAGTPWDLEVEGQYDTQ
jgi:hypothetical protein